MKKIFTLKIMLLLFVANFALASWAQDKVKCLAVAYESSEEVDYFALGAKPIITYGENATINVTQEGDDVYSIEDVSLDDIKECYFEEAVPTDVVPEGIESVPTMNGSMAEFSKDQVLITGLKDGVQVYVYTADGQTVVSAVAGKDGKVGVDLNSLKSGQVYILRTPKASYKIVK